MIGLAGQGAFTSPGPDGDEEIRVEGGSMVTMSDRVSLKIGATGGLWRSLARSWFGGEMFFQKTCQAPSSRWHATSEK
ncbi:AIM24 family protein [Chloroflexota bacterium]